MMDEYGEFVKALGKRLKDVRKSKGLSTYRLADAIGMSKNAVLNYEHTWTCMSAWTLFKICRELGVSADEMLGLKMEDGR